MVGALSMTWIDSERYINVRPNQKKPGVSTKPTDPAYLCRPYNFYCLAEKNKKIFIPTDPKMFQKIGQKALKMSELLN